METHIPIARHEFGPHRIPASTFDGIPFNINMAPDEIGHGATSKIFKGEIEGRPLDQLVVAVKVFGHMLGTYQEQLLVRELHAARRVAMRCHRSILAFLGTAHIGQHQAIVSLYMKNGNLLEYIKKNPQADKEKLILQVAEAVTFLHTVEGLAHGDLKCANVLISDFGDALLADFGLSSFIEETVTRTMTAIRSMNTLSFAAPELLLGSPDPAAPIPSKSRESDVYAFGMLILEVLTGKMPFHGLGSAAVMYRVCSGQLPARPTMNGLVIISSAWWEVCRSCWMFDPSERPPMQDVLQSLSAADLIPERVMYVSGRGTVLPVAYMPCGRRIVSCSDEAIEIQYLVSGQLMSRHLTPFSIPIRAVSPSGSQIASPAEDWAIRRWDALSGDLVGQHMRGHTSRVNCIAYSLDGTRIVSGSHDLTIRLWNASTGEAIGAPLEGHTHWVKSVAFSPDGSRIVSASDDESIRIWDSESGNHLAAWVGQPGGMNSVCYVPDGRLVVSGSRDCAVRIWNARTLELVHIMRGHSAGVLCIAVSPSGEHIASGSWDQTIRIWATETGAPVGGPLTGHSRAVDSVTFSPDGKNVVSGSRDGTVRIWELFE